MSKRGGSGGSLSGVIGGGNVSRLISFFFMLCLVIFIVYIIYKLLTGKIKLKGLMDNLLR